MDDDLLKLIFMLITFLSSSVPGFILFLQYYRKNAYENFATRRKVLTESRGTHSGGLNVVDGLVGNQLILPIYLKFLWLHMIQSTLWVFLVTWAQYHDNAVFYSWGHITSVQKGFMYVYGSGFLLGVNAGLNEGVYVCVCVVSHSLIVITCWGAAIRCDTHVSACVCA